jgi:ubiquinone/menaquinone biosynthesis C-methylase UbiE
MTWPERSEATGRGRLLDLACGSGQVTFALVGRFGQVWFGNPDTANWDYRP